MTCSPLEAGAVLAWCFPMPAERRLRRQVRSQEGLPWPAPSHPWLPDGAHRQPRPQGVSRCLAQAGTLLAVAPVDFPRPPLFRAKCVGAQIAAPLFAYL